MKKILIYAVMAAGLLLTGCLRETEITTPTQKGFRLKLSVEAIGSNLTETTRASVPAVEGEEAIDELTLLFFNYSPSQSGEFVKAYVISNPSLTESINLEIGYGLGEGLSHTENYSILAYANLSAYGPSITSFEGQTESDVEQNMTLALSSGSVILKNSLPMGGRTNKMASQELIDLRLTRAVARIDVVSTIADTYDLKSVTIYGASNATSLWNAEEAGTGYISPFYGTGTNGTSASLTGDDSVTGGLYVFENFEGDPTANHASTTAIVVELSPKAGALVGTPGTNYFYRIDIRPDEQAQNLSRNNVYVVSLNGVLDEGKLNAAEAADAPGGLDYTINNWSEVPGEVIVVTDGKSTMVIPSKIIHFGPNAQDKTLNITTIGPGTLSITRTDLPGGLSAGLDGNTLTVSADALPEFEPERTGTFEVGYGGLRGTVTVIQRSVNDKFIELDKDTLKPWNSTEIESPAENLITVSASGAWVAEIFNTSADPQNPGFAFNDVTGNQAPVKTWSGDPGDTLEIFSTGANASNDFRRAFMKVTLADDAAYSVVMTLVQNAKGNVRISPAYMALPFDAVGNATGVMGSGDPVQPQYRIDVFPGFDNPGDPMRAWKYEMTGADADKFSVIRIDDPSAPYLIISAKGDDPQYPGLNMTNAKSALLTISLDLGATPDSEPVELPITQEALTFSVKRISQLSEVPVTGTNSRTKQWNAKRDDFTWSEDNYSDYVEFKVELNAVLRYDVQIEQTRLNNEDALPYRHHEGYFVGDDGLPMRGVKTLSGQSASKTVKIGFDKIYYPMVHWGGDPGSGDNNIPELTLTFSVPGISDLEPVEFIVRQEPLVADVLDMRIASSSATDNGGYGSMDQNSSSYITRFNRVIMNMDANNFGPSGTVRMQMRPVDTPGLTSAPYVYMDIDDWDNTPDVIIQPTRNYIHASAHDVGGGWDTSAFRALEKWRIDPMSQGMVLFCGMDEGTSRWPSDGLMTYRDPNSTFTKLGYWPNMQVAWGGYPAQGYSNTAVTEFDLDDFETRVMKYLTKGPFGTVDRTGHNFGSMDDAHGTITRSTLDLSPNAVVVMTENGYTDNVLVMVDPVSRIAFLGESQQFDTGAMDTTQEIAFVGNFVSLLMNAAQYGDHFLELLYEDCDQPLYLPGKTTPVIPAP